MAGRLILMVLILFAMRPALAENIVAALSSPTVEISSNFTGADLTIFGTIERDRATVSRAEPYDLLVAISGPPESSVTRKKSRFFGIWINRKSRTFIGVPSLYYVLTTRPLSKVATPGILAKFQIGAINLVLPDATKAGEGGGLDKEFGDAFLRLKEEANLYAQIDDGVKFLTPSLYRADVHLPANLPVGDYKADIFLFRGGALLARHSEKIAIKKTGFEHYTTVLAHQEPLIYGLVTIAMALLTGWLAGVIFRKD